MIMANEKIFEIKGEIQEKGKNRPFLKKVNAKTETFATEKVICLFGSKNKIKRNKIFIQETKEVKTDGKKGN